VSKPIDIDKMLVKTMAEAPQEVRLGLLDAAKNSLTTMCVVFFEMLHQEHKECGDKDCNVDPEALMEVFIDDLRDDIKFSVLATLEVNGYKRDKRTETNKKTYQEILRSLKNEH